MCLEWNVEGRRVKNNASLCFATTPVVKVFVLSIVTYGVYDVIMAFNYWKSLKENFGYKVSPFWRSWFLHFTNFKLFPIFAKYFKHFNFRLVGARWLAVLYFICFMIGSILVSGEMRNFYTVIREPQKWLLEGTYLFLNSICASVFAFIQHRINRINEQCSLGAKKNQWKVPNTIWLIVYLGIRGVALLRD